MRKRGSAQAPDPTTEAATDDRSSVEETSRKLQEELNHSNGIPTIPKFDSAHRPAETPLTPGWDPIVETTFVEDPVPIWRQLEADLRIGERRTDHGTVNKALDDANVNARAAFQLFASAELVKEKWKLENGHVHAGMWEEASRTLQAEKDNKQRNKTITDADVRARCLLLFGDEYKHQELRKLKVEKMVESMKNLMERWNDRCFGLKTMLDKQR